MHCSKKIGYIYEEEAMKAVKEVKKRNRRANGFLKKYGVQLARKDDRLMAYFCRRCRLWHTGNSKYPIMQPEDSLVKTEPIMHSTAS